MRLCNAFSENINIMSSDEADEVIKNFELVTGSEFVFDYVQLMSSNKFQLWWTIHRFSLQKIKKQQ